MICNRNTCFIQNYQNETPGIPNSEILLNTFKEKRILITEDKDFGELVYRFNKPTVFVKILSFGIIMLIVSCTSKQSEFRGTFTSEELLNEIIDKMEAESINRESIDWDDFRNQVFSVANSSASDSNSFYGYEQGTLLAIRKALELLNDNHSMYRTSYGNTIRGNTRSCTAPHPDIPDIPDHIGYLKVGSVNGTGSETAVYSASLQKKIEKQDNEEIIGWIIDLRGNTGGNMAPMLAGISSILEEGITGYFIDPNGNEVVHEIKNNAFLIDGEPIHKLSEPMYKLSDKLPNVAVLIDNTVRSAGEALAISFKKRPNTKFFGSPTCGLSTANYGTQMQSGGMLILTVSTMADKKKKLYGDSVLPDVFIEEPSEVVEQAIEWLYSL